MKQGLFIITVAALISLSACTQDASDPVEDVLTMAEQAQFDALCKKAAEAGCRVSPNVTVADKRYMLQQPIEDYEKFFEFEKGYRVNQETGEGYYIDPSDNWITQ